MKQPSTSRSHILRASCLLLAFAGVFVFATTILVDASPVKAAAEGLGQNICDHNDSSIYCNCDDLTDARQLTCYITSNKTTAEHPIWLMFRSQPKVSHLKLSSYAGQTLNELPLIAFSILQNELRTVQLSDLNFTHLHPGIFQSMPVLETVEIQLCPHMHIESNAFSQLPKLNKLVLEANRLPVLGDMFDEVPRLRELYLEDNLIERIEPHAFSALANLSYLSLEKNRIATIQREMFTGLRRLTELEMPHNQLGSIPAHAFAEIPQLEMLDLSHNQISTLDPDAFAGLQQMANIKLEHNRLNTISSPLVFTRLPGIMLIDLSYNNLQHLSKGAFYHPEQKHFIRIRVKGR